MAKNDARIIQWAQREVAVREISIDGWPDKQLPRECEGSHAIVYAGHGRTGGGGSWTVSLRAINCIPPGPAHDRQPSVVATPTTDGPTGGRSPSVHSGGAHELSDDHCVEFSPRRNDRDERHLFVALRGGR